jgi:hypothetical protein
MPYDPPKTTDKYFLEAYNLGYYAAKEGKSERANPYNLSGHERDTTFENELNFQWYSGWGDYD